MCVGAPGRSRSWGTGETPTGQSSEVVVECKEPWGRLRLSPTGNHEEPRWDPLVLLTPGKVQGHVVNEDPEGVCSLPARCHLRKGQWETGD